jgi:hypothetical protein
MLDRRRRPPARLGELAWNVAWLAAQIAVEDGELAGALRRTSREAVELAGRLEGVLGRLAVLEARFERTVRKVEARNGQEVGEEVFAQLIERFGVAAVRPALERLEQAHPDQALDGSSAEGPPGI